MIEKPKKLFSHAATILPVSDIEASANYYEEKLGFDITFRWGDPVDYVVMNREEAVSIHLSKSDSKPSNQLHTTLYVFVHDVDALYAEYLEKKVNISTEIADRDYGMRDFDITDPDGYILSFGKGIE